MTKKILPLLVFTLIFSGCSWFQQSQTTTDKIIYENQELNFSIELPSSAKGYNVSVDRGPIPPEATQTIGFLLNGGGFLSIEVYNLDNLEESVDKNLYENNEIGRSDKYLFVARQVSGGLPDSYRLSEDEFEIVKNSFKELE